MCLYPKLYRNPKYKPNKKNGWQSPAVNDPRVLHVPIGCGDCIECRKQKANGWRTRLMEDIKKHTNSVFVTLTFSNEEYTKLSEEIINSKKPDQEKLTGYYLDNAIATLAVKRFLGRWRKEYKKSIRHWLVTEIGHNGTENIHLHGLLWTDNKYILPKIWQYGYVFQGTWVNEQTINYIVKYVTKQDPKHKHYKPIMLTSPGIGGEYINTYNATLNKYTPGDTKETYTTRQGTKSTLPTYYRNKLYTDEEKESLWIEKIDKHTRFVLGTKIDTSKGLNDYYKALKYAQKINKDLGYGNGTTTWDKAEYEIKLRELKQNERRAPRRRAS